MIKRFLNWIRGLKSSPEKPLSAAEIELNRVNKKIHEMILNKMGRDGIDYENAKIKVLESIKARIEEQRYTNGALIKCIVCRSGGCNRSTGSMIKLADGTYRHSNCSLIK